MLVSGPLNVLRVLDWLNAWGYGHVHLAAKGYGALPSTFAALLSPPRDPSDAEERFDLLQ